ncbi:MAG TPA: hypothetical protein VLR26_14390 [Frankiaceae bacterium]|nr:hypothetical protein [Frankiaceae bacterium]
MGSYPRGLGASLAAVTVGAILAFAITTSTPGISLPAVGTILMVMGAIGFVTVLYLDWAARRTPKNDQNFVGRNYDDGSTYQQQTYQQPPRY